MFYWDALGGSAPAAWASYGEEGVIFGKTEGANYPHGGRPRGGGTVGSPLERLTSQCVIDKHRVHIQKYFPHNNSIRKRFRVEASPAASAGARAGINNAPDIPFLQ
jgi:hypothetical protein